MTPAKDGALAVVDPTKEEENPKPDVRAPPAPPTTKHLLGDAYPDMMSMASTALDFWVKGKTEVRHSAARFLLLWCCAWSQGQVPSPPTPLTYQSGQGKLKPNSGSS